MLEKLDNVSVHVCESINSVGAALCGFFHQKSQNRNITRLTIIYLRLEMWHRYWKNWPYINLGSEDGLILGDCFLPYSVVYYFFGFNVCYTFGGLPYFPENYNQVFGAGFGCGCPFFQKLFIRDWYWVPIWGGGVNTSGYTETCMRTVCFRGNHLWIIFVKFGSILLIFMTQLPLKSHVKIYREIFLLLNPTRKSM